MLLKTYVTSFLLACSISSVLIQDAVAYDTASLQVAAAASRALTTSSAVRLKRIRYSAPEYPSKALRQQLSGHVTIDFVVDANGDPTELRVVETHPAGVFDRAVLEAVRRWRYIPVVANDARTKAARRAIVYFKVPGKVLAE